jgi:hypothetical protein
MVFPMKVGLWLIQRCEVKTLQFLPSPCQIYVVFIEIDIDVRYDISVFFIIFIFKYLIYRELAEPKVEPGR